MPSDHIQVTIDELQSVSSQFNARAAELEQLLQLLKNQMEALNSTWQGQAAPIYQELMMQWNINAQGIHNVLAEYSRYLARAASAYQEMDASIARGFQV